MAKLVIEFDTKDQGLSETEWTLLMDQIENNVLDFFGTKEYHMQLTEDG